MKVVRFKPYLLKHRDGCLALFDRNCPQFFAPVERNAYADFLQEISAGYRVGLSGGAIVCAYGLEPGAPGRVRLRWVLVDPSLHRQGIGRSMLYACIADARSRGARVIDIAASQKSAPFFARFGADKVGCVRDGWGAGLHRVDMELSVLEEN